MTTVVPVGGRVTTPPVPTTLPVSRPAPPTPARELGHPFASAGDGIEIRPLGDGDAMPLRSLLERMSPASLERRFFGPVAPQLPWIAEQLARTDDPRQYGVVATHGDDIVGHASLHVVPGAPDTAEVAVMVDDAWQRQGLARRLLRALTGVARDRGITRYEAVVLAANRPALAMVRTLAPGSPARFDGPEIHVDIDVPGLRPPPAAV